MAIEEVSTALIKHHAPLHHPQETEDGERDNNKWRTHKNARSAHLSLLICPRRLRLQFPASFIYIPFVIISICLPVLSFVTETPVSSPLLPHLVGGWLAAFHLLMMMAHNYYYYLREKSP